MPGRYGRCGDEAVSQAMQTDQNLSASAGLVSDGGNREE